MAGPLTPDSYVQRRCGSVLIHAAAVCSVRFVPGWAGTINSGFGGRPYRYNYAATNEPS